MECVPPRSPRAASRHSERLRARVAGRQTCSMHPHSLRLSDSSTITSDMTTRSRHSVLQPAFLHSDTLTSMRCPKQRLLQIINATNRENHIRVMTPTIAPSFHASLATARKVTLWINLSIVPRDIVCSAFVVTRPKHDGLLYGYMATGCCHLQVLFSFKSSGGRDCDCWRRHAWSWRLCVGCCALPFLRTTKITFQDFYQYLGDAMHYNMQQYQAGNHICPSLDSIGFQDCPRLDPSLILRFIEDHIQAESAFRQDPVVELVFCLREVEADEKLIGVETC
jgi:hypothetical protein